MSTLESSSNPVPPRSELISIDPKELLHALRKRKWLILLCAVAVGGAVAAGTARQPKVYKAVARLLIDAEVPKILGEEATIDELGAQARTQAAFYNTQFQIIKSRSVVRAAIKAAELEQNAAFLASYEITAPEGEPRLKAIEGVMKNILRVAPEVQSRIVNLVVEDFDAERAARIANQIGQSYIDATLERRLSTVRGASSWLDERVDEFKNQLEGAEKQLQEFREKHMLISVSLEDRQNMISGSLTTLNQKLIETRTQLISLRSERKVMQDAISASDKGAGLDAVPIISRNPIITELKTSITSLYKQKAENSARYGEKHPVMQGIEKQIAEAQDRLSAEAGLIIAALDHDIAALDGAEIELAKAMAEEKDKAIQLNNLSLEYNQLSRGVGTTKSMYENLLTRHTQADLSGLLESNFVRWMEMAEADPRPVRPILEKNAALGLLLGAFLGILIAVGAMLLDNTVKGQTDLEALLNLPFLGILPSIEGETKTARARSKSGAPAPVESNTRDLYIVSNPKSAVAECARSIRTNLMFLSTGRSLKKVLLTSAGPAEGKSTTAIALGITMAQAGNRVLVVDTDLRRPRLHRVFGVSGEVGLTSVLLGSNTVESAIKRSEVVGLDLLPCGPLPPNPAELLHTDGFAKIVKELEARYDRIIFDSPPVNAVTDAIILSQIVDGTILVVKAMGTPREAIRRTARHLQDVRAHVLGVVLNDVDFEEGGYAQHYYYQRYGYAYGTEPERGA